MPRLARLLLCTLLLGFAGAIGPLAPARAGGTAGAGQIVARSGTQLTLGGRPWRFVALNDYGLTSMPGGYDCGPAPTQAELNATMQEAVSHGVKVIRTWFFQSFYDLSSSGGATTPSWAAFDRVLDTAAAYGLKVIPVLVNEWQQCEPPSIDKNLSFFQSGYRQPGYGYPLSFRSYAVAVAQHYAGDPTIAFWQLGNELENNTPSGCDQTAEATGTAALRGFADDVATAIKAVDPQHLISLGTVGSGQCGLANADYSNVMAGAIDICDYHDYGSPLLAMPTDGYNQLAQRLQQCAALGKPIVVSESGIAGGVGPTGLVGTLITQASLALRATLFQAKMTAAFTAGVQGYGLWDIATAGVPASAASDPYLIGPQDPALTAVSRIAAQFAPGVSAPASSSTTGAPGSVHAVSRSRTGAHPSRSGRPALTHARAHPHARHH